MKANQFFNKIIDQWPVKICCLLLAVSIYLFHQSSLIDKRSFEIPLQVIEEGGVIHNDNIISSVTVVIRANTEQITSIHSSQINAYVNLNNLSKKGEYTVPVNVDVADEIKGFDPFEIRVKPEYIKIKVENKDLKYVTLEPSIVGEPEHGYEITEININPSTVEIIGPQSLLENTKKMYTQRVDVTGIKNDSEYQVKYKPVNKLLNITDENEEFTVSVKVVPQKMERIIENIPIYIDQLNEKLYIQNTLPQLTAKLTGTVPVLENYTPAKNFASINFSNITVPGEYDLPIVFRIPSSLELLEQQEQTIHVNVLSVEEEVINPEIGLGILE